MDGGEDARGAGVAGRASRSRRRGEPAGRRGVPLAVRTPLRSRCPRRFPMIRWSLGIALAVGILLALSPLAVASAVLPAGRAASGPPSLDAASAHAGARSQDRDAYDEDDRSGPGGGGDDGDDSSGHGGDDEDP